MKYISIFVLVFIFACGTLKNTGARIGNNFRLNIEVVAGTDKVNLNGLAFVSKDSNFLSVYGPLGISVAKIQTKGDSLTFVDIQNKKLYKSSYRSVSSGFYNIFTGNYSSSEEVLLCRLTGLLIQNVNKNLQCNQGGRINYQFKSAKKRNTVYLSLGNVETNYKAKVEFSGTENTNFGNLTKYENFETISISLQ